MSHITKLRNGMAIVGAPFLLVPRFRLSSQYEINLPTSHDATTDAGKFTVRQKMLVDIRLQLHLSADYGTGDAIPVVARSNMTLMMSDFIDLAVDSPVIQSLSDRAAKGEDESPREQFLYSVSRYARYLQKIHEEKARAAQTPPPIAGLAAPAPQPDEVDEASPLAEYEKSLDKHADVITDAAQSAAREAVFDDLDDLLEEIEQLESRITLADGVTFENWFSSVTEKLGELLSQTIDDAILDT